VHGDYSKSFSAPSLYGGIRATDSRQGGSGVIQAFLVELHRTSVQRRGRQQPEAAAGDLDVAPSHPDPAQCRGGSEDSGGLLLDQPSGLRGGIGFNTILASINALGSASPYFNNLAIDNFVGGAGASQPFANPGCIEGILDQRGHGQGRSDQANRCTSSINSEIWPRDRACIRINASYVIPTERDGTFTLSTVGAIFTDFNFQALPAPPIFNTRARPTRGRSGGFGGTLPKYRFFTTLD